jgi:hypothetical protein
VDMRKSNERRGPLRPDMGRLDSLPQDGARTNNVARFEVRGPGVEPSVLSRVGLVLRCVGAKLVR